MIAHRLSTIIDADKIIVVKDGQLVEMGKHQEILDKFPKGTYAGFVAKQKSAEEQHPEQSEEKGVKEEDKSPKKQTRDPEEEFMLAKVNEIDK